MKNKVIFIVGPTAVGKTEVAVCLAQKINAEIVSCDSMQIYKGMDIISSKPRAVLRRKIPHHLIDIVEPSRIYNVSLYRKTAMRKIREITEKKRIPLFVGGTGLYVSILLDGIFKAKSENSQIRQRLYKEAEEFGSNYLHARLKKVDPQAAAKIHPHDARRIVRALEIFVTTGHAISQLQPQRKGMCELYDVRVFCLDMERQSLYRRIDMRVEEMFKQGLINEVKKLLRLTLSKTAQYAIGMRELKVFFDGRCDLEKSKELMKRNTRRYAKRQLTWFRKDKRIRWIELREHEKPSSVAKRIVKILEMEGEKVLYGKKGTHYP